MKPQVRELLVTAKVAQNWHSLFNEKVEELMVLVNKVDTDKLVLESGELLDVYHKTKQKPKKQLPKNNKFFLLILLVFAAKQK